MVNDKLIKPVFGKLYTDYSGTMGAFSYFFENALSKNLGEDPVHSAYCYLKDFYQKIFGENGVEKGLFNISAMLFFMEHKKKYSFLAKEVKNDIQCLKQPEFQKLFPKRM